MTGTIIFSNDWYFPTLPSVGFQNLFNIEFSFNIFFSALKIFYFLLSTCISLGGNSPNIFLGMQNVKFFCGVLLMMPTHLASIRCRYILIWSGWTYYDILSLKIDFFIEKIKFT